MSLNINQTILSISADFSTMKFLEFPISLRQLDLKYFEFSRQNHIFPPATHCLKIRYSKCRIWISEFWHFPPIFVLLKLTCLVTLPDRKLQVFKYSPKWTIFGIFNLLLSIQNVNVAGFARNVVWDFFCDFQTLCLKSF